MKELIISDGSKLNIKDASYNVINNCDVYISASKCLLCSSGYVQSYTGSCILSSSCSNID